MTDDSDWISTAQWSRRQALGASTAAAAGFALAAGPISAASIKKDMQGLEEGWVQVPTGDRAIPAYRAKPAGGGPRPVVIVVQEIFGVHAWIQDIVRRFAKAGYYAIAPDFYVRQGDATKVADIPTLVRTIVSKVPDTQVMSDLDAAAAFSATDGGDADLLGVTGFCWGGAVTWMAAARFEAIDAGVAWYGRLAPPAEPDGEARPWPVDVAGELKAPVLGLYAGQDRGIALDTVEMMRAALAAGDDTGSEIVVYPEASHGFHADYRVSYDAAAAEDGWRRLLAHFAVHLAG